ncbi:MAG: glycogen-binding domain-containing protein [Bacteroides sp.]|nr:glycogen-binding domain-containing protein [Prevotella sp.]MCM1408440.1 glycogen-binding domain-containing protein [Treponema brennaborense]MCM1469398.1 glycogen-binding domain-containing protein [Bacteroides sp.]
MKAQFKFFSAAMILCSVFRSAFLPAANIPAQEQEEALYARSSLVSAIQEPCAPFFSEEYIIFTAESTHRYAGIAFDFENFSIIHTYERLVSYDDQMQPEDSVLFYILKAPENISRISYRIITDGLWSTDPLNPNKFFSREHNLELSLINVPPKETNRTETKARNTVRFVYQAESGKHIRLAGTFTNWDSFIYELEEKQEGIYELELPLPAGTYYYTFFDGITELMDPANGEKAYTADGRIASVLTVH